MHHHSSAEKVSSLRRSRPSQTSSPALDCRKRWLLRLLLVLLLALVLLLLVLLLRRPSRVLLLQAAIHIIRPAGRIPLPVSRAAAALTRGHPVQIPTAARPLARR